MREIRFRGKRLDNGEWVYGYPFELQRGQYVIYQPGDTASSLNIWDYIRLHSYEVDPETVGQSIGRKDMHGTEVYDGDILEEHYTSLEISRYKVEWDQESAMWVFNDGKDRVFAEDIDFSLTEVKGNKWDHPHLLKGVSE
jgi:uncharacterized phage protein (TIGR01671 family)